MNAGFSTTQLGGKALELFQHDLCRIRYQADLFWVTEAVSRASIEELLEVFSRDREGRAQSVITTSKSISLGEAFPLTKLPNK